MTNYMTQLFAYPHTLGSHLFTTVTEYLPDISTTQQALGSLSTSFKTHASQTYSSLCDNYGYFSDASLVKEQHLALNAIDTGQIANFTRGATDYLCEMAYNHTSDERLSLAVALAGATVGAAVVLAPQTCKKTCKAGALASGMIAYKALESGFNVIRKHSWTLETALLATSIAAVYNDRYALAAASSIAGPLRASFDQAFRVRKSINVLRDHCAAMQDNGKQINEIKKESGKHHSSLRDIVNKFTRESASPNKGGFKDVVKRVKSYQEERRKIDTLLEQNDKKIKRHEEKSDQLTKVRNKHLYDVAVRSISALALSAGFASGAYALYKTDGLNSFPNSITDTVGGSAAAAAGISSLWMLHLCYEHALGFQELQKNMKERAIATGNKVNNGIGQFAEGVGKYAKKVGKFAKKTTKVFERYTPLALIAVETLTHRDNILSTQIQSGIPELPFYASSLAVPAVALAARMESMNSGLVHSFVNSLAAGAVGLRYLSNDTTWNLFDTACAGATAYSYYRSLGAASSQQPVSS
jgi:X-X-X-Leu-X-X-Gly heptad repeat protein